MAFDDNTISVFAECGVEFGVTLLTAMAMEKPFADLRGAVGEKTATLALATLLGKQIGHVGFKDEVLKLMDYTIEHVEPKKEEAQDEQH